MARPREFDEAAALDAAVECFRTRGYEATSVRDLAEGMGINGASLYNAFGDKRTLYRRALDHYLDGTARAWIARLERTLPPREAIAAFFGGLVEQSLADKQRRGCLLLNCALEVAPHDAGLRRLVGDELAQIEAFFRRCIEAGQGDGSIAATHGADDLARTLLGMLLGVRVLARTRPQRALLEGAVRPVLALLAPPRAQSRPSKPTRRPTARARAQP